MRPIKFRGYCPDYEKWYYGDLITFNGEPIEISFYDNDEHETGGVSIDPSSVGQSTGLLDKNGREIYENDILDVKFYGGYMERISWRGNPDARCKVIWDLCGFRLECFGKDDHRFADFMDINRKESEVIGNTTDNPELLKNDTCKIENEHVSEHVRKGGDK